MSLFDSFRDSLMKGDCNLQIEKFFGETPLLNALQYRNCPLDVVKLLLDKGADVNYTPKDGYSTLAVALTYSNDEAVILELLERGAEVNKLCSFQRTPLLVLLQRRNCSVAILKLLLRYGADVNCSDIYQDSALTTAIQNSENDLVIQVLLEAGAKADKEANLNKNPLLTFLRYRENCSSDMVKLFVHYGANVNCVGMGGYSPLEIAIQYTKNVAIIQALLEKGAMVNRISKYNESPLIMLLRNYNCSVGAVKLLLKYNADVNYTDGHGNSSLNTAIVKSRGEKIIRDLLDKGASVNALDNNGRSPLCHALKHSSHDEIKMLLDAGCSPTACKYHSFPLFCATDNSKSGLREDILKRLLENRTNRMNCYFENGQSVLCYALHRKPNACDIELMLDKGASLDACRRHKSPMICATVGSGTKLRESVLKLLLNRGACVGDSGWEVMEGALRWCDYEVEAIQLLLDLPGIVDCIVAGKENKESILHLAVMNRHCKLGAVELLVSRISQVHKVIKKKETLLHSAIENECQPSIIKLLLKSSFPMNEKNEYHETPLAIAVRKGYNADVMKELLIAGAQIGEEKCIGRKVNNNEKCFLLEFVLEQYHYDTSYQDHTDRIIKWFKILVKFFFLQNPQFGLGDCHRVSYQNLRSYATWNYEKFTQFVNDCLKELQKMESMQIGEGFTLREFVRGYCLSNKLPHDYINVDKKNYKLNQLLKNMANECLPKEPSSDCNLSEKASNLDQLLRCMAQNEFTVYFDVFLARLDRSVMKMALPNLKIYTSNKGPDSLKIYLNEDVLNKISSFLSNDNLLRFILAFYNPEQREPCHNNQLGAKRSSESTTNQHRKCTKLH